MKIILVSLLLLGHLWADEVGRVVFCAPTTHVKRNFELVYLSNGSPIFRRDLIEVQQGTMELKVGSTVIRAEKGSRIEVRRQMGQVMVTFLKGRLILDARAGESWMIDHALGQTKGRLGMVHLEMSEDGVEITALDEGLEWKPKYAQKWVTMEANSSGLWEEGNLSLVYLRSLNGFEQNVYRESLMANVVQAGEMLLDLEGQPFVPYRDIQALEHRRRKSLGIEREFHALATKVDQMKGEQTKRELKRNVDEGVVEDLGFEFPDPLSPPPSSR